MTAKTKKAQRQTPAVNAYFEKYSSIQDKIAILQDLADDHFGHDPDEINWAHVGDLGHVESALDDLLAMFEHEMNNT